MNYEKYKKIKEKRYERDGLEKLTETLRKSNNIKEDKFANKMMNFYASLIRRLGGRAHKHSNTLYHEYPTEFEISYEKMNEKERKSRMCEGFLFFVKYMNNFKDSYEDEDEKDILNALNNIKDEEKKMYVFFSSH